MGRLIRTYMVWELIYQICDQQTANRVEQKKKKKEEEEEEENRGVQAVHSLGLKRPLIFWTS